MLGSAASLHPHRSHFRAARTRGVIFNKCSWHDFVVDPLLVDGTTNGSLAIHLILFLFLL